MEGIRQDERLGETACTDEGVNLDGRRRPNAPNVSSQQPRDALRMAYLIFLLQGIGMLFPWNMFITASDYFKVRFRGSSFADNFQSFFSINSTLCNMVFMAIFVFAQVDRRLSSSQRIFTGWCLSAIVFFITTMMPSMHWISPYLYFYLTMILISISAFSTAILQKGLYGIASLFPPIYLQAIFAGQGLSGVVVSLISVLSILGSAEEGDQGDPLHFGDTIESMERQAFIYFLCAFVIILVSLFGYILLPKLPMYKYYVGKSADQGHTVRIDGEGDAQRGTDNAMAIQHGNDVPACSSTVSTETTHLLPKSPKIKSKEPDIPEETDIAFGTSDPTQEASVHDSNQEASVATLFSRLRPLLAGIFLVFFVTLALFPSLISLIESSAIDSRSIHRITFATLPRLLTDLFVPFSFLVFNVGDWIGKVLSAYPWTHRVAGLGYSSDNALFFASLARFAFFPFFLVCNVVLRDSMGEPLTPYIPTWVTSDVVYFVGLMVFAVGNGLVASVVMMRAPQRVNHPAAKERAGALMAFFLTGGLTVGSLFSFALRSMLCQCNPFLS